MHSRCDLAIWVWIYCCFHLHYCEECSVLSLSQKPLGMKVSILLLVLALLFSGPGCVPKNKCQNKGEVPNTWSGGNLGPGGKVSNCPCNNNMTLYHFRVQFCIWPKVLPFCFLVGSAVGFCASGRSLFWDLTNCIQWPALVSNTGFISQVTFAVLAITCSYIFYLNICLVTRKAAVSPLPSSGSLFRIIHCGLSGCPPYHTVLYFSTAKSNLILNPSFPCCWKRDCVNIAQILQKQREERMREGKDAGGTLWSVSAAQREKL